MTDFEHQDDQTAKPASAAVEPTSAANARSARRRWFQYSLRTLFVVSILVALGIVTAWKECIEPYQRERQLAMIVAELGGTVSTEAAGPAWLQPLLPAGQTNVVTGISISPLVELRDFSIDRSDRPLTKDLIQRIGAAPGLRTLGLRHGNLSDADVASLARSTSIERIDLAYTPITDRGAGYLRGLSSLRCVRLDGTRITDASLTVLATLPDLELLALNQTHVTSAGLDAFRAKRPTVKLTCVKMEFQEIVPIRESEPDRQTLKSDWANFSMMNLGDEPVEVFAGFPQQTVLFGPNARNKDFTPFFLSENLFYESRMVGSGEQSSFTLHIRGNALPGVPRRCGASVRDASIDEFPEGQCVFSDWIALPAE
jgi:hypothetical protein